MGRRSNRKFNNRQRRKPYYGSHNKKQFNDLNRDVQFSVKKEHDYKVKDSLKEDQVAITEYINEAKGFSGILKSRFSDFHVNEIDLNAQILQLNDINIPEEKEDNFSIEEATAAKDELKSIITEEVWNRLSELKKAKFRNNENPKDSEVILDVSGLDKEQRTLIHRVIKKLYESKLVSHTLKEEEMDEKDAKKRFISVMKSRGRDRNRWTFPKLFVHFLVHKENFDTSEVASLIAQKLNLRPSQVNYCGTKDKRGKTTQKFCIKKRSPRQIAGTVKFLTGVTIGNFSFKNKTLKLGDLRGNRFRIAIRNLSGERQHIENSLNNMKEQGFINYFGLQRFGNCSSIPTYDVGVALLKADYKLACELILKPRDNDVPFLKSIREIWWKNRDSKAAAALFRSDRFIEKKLLNGLAQFGENDYAAALRKIPRNMLLLYPHAFQSLIFNFVATKRIQEFGVSLLPGDLVYLSKEEFNKDIESTEFTDQEENEENERENSSLTTGNEEGSRAESPDQEKDDDEKETENSTLSTENNENSIAEQADEEEDDNEEDIENSTQPMVNTESLGKRFTRPVKHLTEEEIASGEYTIYDMLLPLPGHDITYPENIVGSWYEEFMENYGLSSEMLRHNVKLFSMKGAYRRLVEKPRDMSWEFKTYSTPDETLILSDLEMLEGKTLEDFKKVGMDPKYEALLLDFCLPPSCYATMMLRELLKCDTSAAAQSILLQAVLKEHTEETEIEKNTQNEEEALGEKRKANDNEIIEDIKSAKLLKDNE